MEQIATPEFHTAKPPLLDCLLNSNRSKAGRLKAAEMLMGHEKKIQLEFEGEEVWKWALTEGEWICAEFYSDRVESLNSIRVDVDFHPDERQLRKVMELREAELGSASDPAAYIDESEQKPITSKFKFRFLGLDSRELKITQSNFVLIMGTGTDVEITWFDHDVRHDIEYAPRRVDAGESAKTVVAICVMNSFIDQLMPSERLLITEHILRASPYLYFRVVMAILLERQPGEIELTKEAVVELYRQFPRGGEPSVDDKESAANDFCRMLERHFVWESLDESDLLVVINLPYGKLVHFKYLSDKPAWRRLRWTGSILNEALEK